MRHEMLLSETISNFFFTVAKRFRKLGHSPFPASPQQGHDTGLGQLGGHHAGAAGAGLPPPSGHTNMQDYAKSYEKTRASGHKQ